MHTANADSSTDAIWLEKRSPSRTAPDQVSLSTSLNASFLAKERCASQKLSAAVSVDGISTCTSARCQPALCFTLVIDVGRKQCEDLFSFFLVGFVDRERNTDRNILRCFYLRKSKVALLECLLKSNRGGSARLGKTVN